MTARLKGLAALVGLLAVVVGVPWVLVAIGAGPVPDSAPTLDGMWSAVTTPDDGTVFITLFRYAAWLAWLFFVVSLVLELVARAGGREAPRLPGLSLPQGAARALVGTAALLFVAAPVMTSVAAPAGATGSADQAGSTVAASSVAAGAETGAVHASTVQTAADADADDRAENEAQSVSETPTTDHVVAQGETLWSIAETQLGDGARYPEIVNLNPGTITESHWISPGTTIAIPDESGAAADSDESGSESTYTVEKGDTLWEIAEDELGEGERYPEIVAATGDAEQPDGDRLTDPDLIRPGWQLQVPGEGGAAAAGPSSTGPSSAEATRDATRAATDAEAATDRATQQSTTTGLAAAATAQGLDAAAQAGPGTTDEAGPGWGTTALGLGGVTAAAALALLELARRRRARTLGRPPAGDALDPREAALAGAADAHTVATIDLALRHLALAAEQSGRAVPGLRSVRMTEAQIDVQLSSPMRLPAPWTSTADPRLWTLAADRAASLDPTALAGVPAPFPGLVTVGTDDDAGHVLVNLVDARAFAVTGQNVHTRAALAAMTLDLAGSPWAQRTVVTVVGGHDGLVEAIGSPRVRLVAQAADYTPSTVVTADAAAREVVVVSGEIGEAERRHLERAVGSLPRVALLQAAPSADDGAAALAISSDPQVAVLSPSYLQLRPQLLDEQQQADLGELFALARASTDRWAPAADEPSLARIGAAAAAMGAPGILVDADPDALPVDDAPTLRRADLEADEPARDTSPTLWNTPVSTPAGAVARVPGDDVPTARRSSDTSGTADAPTPGWLSNQITPTPGTPLPPVVAFPQRVRELAAPTDAPVLRVLGPVDIDNVAPVDEVHRPRLTELAAFVQLHPAADASAIDDAMWPNRSRHDHSSVRDSSLAALGGWLVEETDAPAGLAAARGLTSDWDLWRALLPGDVTQASTEHLEQALGMVRGRPFVGAELRHYTWATPLRATMVHDITLAAAELARRRLMEGAWSAAYDATVVGLTVEPSVEALWRMQLLAGHELGDRDLVETARAGLDDLASRLGDPLEQRTQQLIADVDALDAPTRTHVG